MQLVRMRFIKLEGHLNPITNVLEKTAAWTGKKTGCVWTLFIFYVFRRVCGSSFNEMPSVFHRRDCDSFSVTFPVLKGHAIVLCSLLELLHS